MIAASTSSFSAAVIVTSAASCGCLADFQQGVMPPDHLILRHVAASLTQEPHWRSIHWLAQAGTNEAGASVHIRQIGADA